MSLKFDADPSLLFPPEGLGSDDVIFGRQKILHVDGRMEEIG